jgi:hypothetical protein
MADGDEQSFIADVGVLDDKVLSFFDDVCGFMGSQWMCMTGLSIEVYFSV